VEPIRRKKEGKKGKNGASNGVGAKDHRWFTLNGKCLRKGDQKKIPNAITKTKVPLSL